MEDFLIDLTVSTFAIYNLFSIQEPDKRLNENQAQSHQWLPISLGVKVQFLQSGSQKVSGSFPTTPPTACSLGPSHRRPLCPLHKSEILLQDLLKGRSLHWLFPDVCPSSLSSFCSTAILPRRLTLTTTHKNMPLSSPTPPHCPTVLQPSYSIFLHSILPSTMMYNLFAYLLIIYLPPQT